MLEKAMSRFSFESNGTFASLNDPTVGVQVKSCYNIDFSDRTDMINDIEYAAMIPLERTAVNRF